MVGASFAPMSSGVPVDDGWALPDHRRRALERPSVAGMSARSTAATASPPCSRSPWGLPGCMARPRPAGSGAGLCNGSRLPVMSDHFTIPDQVRSILSRPTPSSPAPDQRRRRAVQSHAEGTDHPWSHLPQHRGAAGTRPQTSSNSTMPRRSSKRTATGSAARLRSFAWVPRFNQARRVRQTCVEGTRVRYTSSFSRIACRIAGRWRLARSEQAVRRAPGNRFGPRH